MRLCLRCRLPLEAHGWNCGNCGWEPSEIGGFLSFAPDLEASAPSFPEQAYKDLQSFEEGHFWFEGRNRLLVWAIQKCFPKFNRFLEIGCGTGFVLRAVRSANSEADVSGSEIHVSGLAYASMRCEGSDLFQMDARHIPFRDHFDLIGAFDVIEHIRDDEAVLSEINLALRSRGGLLLTVPQHRWLWSPVDVFAGHERRYRRKELVEKLDIAGFDILMVTSFVSGLLPFMYLSRLWKRGHTEAEPELRPSLIANAIGSIVGKLEFIFIRCGLRFPMGGSLLIAARKRK